MSRSSQPPSLCRRLRRHRPGGTRGAGFRTAQNNSSTRSGSKTNSNRPRSSRKRRFDTASCGRIHRGGGSNRGMRTRPAGPIRERIHRRLRRLRARAGRASTCASRPVSTTPSSVSNLQASFSIPASSITSMAPVPSGGSRPSRILFSITRRCPGETCNRIFPSSLTSPSRRATMAAVASVLSISPTNAPYGHRSRFRPGAFPRRSRKPLAAAAVSVSSCPARLPAFRQTVGPFPVQRPLRRPACPAPPDAPSPPGLRQIT